MIFDVLTTTDPKLRKRIQFAYPLIGRLLRWRTSFFGTTVSEYCPLPSEVSAEALPQQVLRSWARRTRLAIVKDVAAQSPLLTAADNEYARRFLASCEKVGFVLVEGQALAYVPIDFVDEEDYLRRLSPGRRRDIRRKLRARSELTISTLPTGNPKFLEEPFIDELYRLYRDVYAQSEVHFDLLSRDFFAAILRDATLNGQLFLYYRAQTLIGYNLCFVHAGMLIDKYIGFRYPEAREHNLYIVSWMQNLAYARERKLSHYVAGWTDPEIKAYLGAHFTLTRHAVYVRNPILRIVLRRLTRWFESDHNVMRNST